MVDSPAPAMTNPFQTEGTWLRCALHAHTTRSDGELQPEALVDHYERAEWTALAVTDHWTITRPPARDGIVLVPGIELTCRTESGTWVDVLVYGLDRELDVRPDNTDSSAAAHRSRSRCSRGPRTAAGRRWDGSRSGTGPESSTATRRRD